MRQAIRVDPEDPEPLALQSAALWLRGGGIVAFPTDTFYGLAVDPTSSSAVRALFAVKGRAADVAVPLIAASLAQVEAVCGPLDGDASRLARAFWPGPLSIVCEAPATIDAGVSASHGSIAIRVPDHAIARALAGAFGGPITATSANRHGEPPARDIRDLVAAIADRVLIVDAGPTRGGSPSTIVDVRVAPARLVREGAVPWKRVLESLQA